MKGFPNQVSDLRKIAVGMRCIVEAGQDARDDGVLGEALVYAGVAGTGHIAMPVDDYIKLQQAKPRGNQSHRTAARLLREFYRLLELINIEDGRITITEDGYQAAGFAGEEPDAAQINFWRRIIRNFTHFGGDAEASHPYQVLLRLVAQRPGIVRAKCALALEAVNDSPEELDRIVALADLPEEEIRRRINVSKSNWDNAKKILPSLAEQLRDIIKIGGGYALADAPGRGNDLPAAPARRDNRVRAPRTSREVTADTIGRAGTADDFDEFTTPPAADPQAVLDGINARRNRLRRHNLILQNLAGRFNGLRLNEDPFDLLALEEETGFLVEVKTLDGTVADERDRVRDALSQLLYYEAFVTTPIAGQAQVHKIACFESPITGAHGEWLNRSGIAVIWQVDDGYRGDELARGIIGNYIEEL